LLTLLGAEVGNDYLNVVACGLRGDVIFSRYVDYRHADVATTVRDLTGLIIETQRAVRTGRRKVLGLGVGVPGMVGPGGQVRLAPGIGWRDSPFGELLREQLRGRGFGDVPMTVLNDANAAALSEHVFGVEAPVGSLVFLSLGYGVGAGIILDHRLHLGHDELAGEVGHTILQPGGERCACGRRGCAETLLSQKVLSRRVTGADQPVLHVAELAEGLDRGDPVLRQVVLEAGEHLGLILHNLVVTVNPEVVILGGPLARLDALVAAAREALARFAGELPYHHGEVRVCRFGIDAAAVGAAGSVLHQALNPLAPLTPGRSGKTPVAASAFPPAARTSHPA
jgi:predicted NBD/HSP70 family sugar kinase